MSRRSDRSIHSPRPPAAGGERCHQEKCDQSPHDSSVDAGRVCNKEQLRETYPVVTSAPIIGWRDAEGMRANLLLVGPICQQVVVGLPLDRFLIACSRTGISRPQWPPG